MVIYSQLDPYKKTSVKSWSKFKHSYKKMHLKLPSILSQHECPNLAHLRCPKQLGCLQSKVFWMAHHPETLTSDSSLIVWWLVRGKCTSIFMICNALWTAFVWIQVVNKNLLLLLSGGLVLFTTVIMAAVGCVGSFVGMDRYLHSRFIAMMQALTTTAFNLVCMT